MRSSTMERWVKLLAYLYHHPNCEVPTIIAELNIKSSSLYDNLNKWLKENIVKKVRKGEIRLGGVKILYSLTPEGESLFFRLKKALNKKQKNDA